MKQTVHESDFRDAFVNRNRSDNFSYAGLGTLYWWLRGFEEDAGEEIELDVIALCCDYTEYDDLDEFHGDHDKDEYRTVDDIADETTVIPIGDTGGFIVGNF